MDLDGNNIIQLTENKVFDGNSAWSPDDSQIAFVSERDDNVGIYVMNADGSGTKSLMYDPYLVGYLSWSPPDQVISSEPWFGTPWCVRDTDGDFQPDTPTSKLKSDESVAYIQFPFRNMEDDTSWSHNWIPENGYSTAMSGVWDSGESGFHVAMNIVTLERGYVTIQLIIEDAIVQEIQCEVVD